MKAAAALLHAACALVLIAGTPAALAQHAGHGDTTAVSPGAGVVAFENSGALAAQKDFLFGLAQLHNFQYDAAAAAFRRAQEIDPDFAMAYWGEAMTYDHPVWVQEDVAAAQAVLQRLAPTRELRLAKARTERERAYLSAVEVLFGAGEKVDRDRRYSLAMERVHQAYPMDIDATAFYALSLLGTVQGVRDVPVYMRSAALMQDVFERYPQHPGAAHYLIHSVDDAAHAPLGLKAADAYGKIAPGSVHALHMTSHIYLALGMWQKTATANETAAEVATRNIRLRNPNAPIPGCGHGHQWLSYAYLQQERVDASRRILQTCADELRTRPSQMTGADLLIPEGSSAGAFHAVRSRYLIDGERWNDEFAKAASEPVALPAPEFARTFTDAYGSLRRRDKAAAQSVAKAAAAGTRLLAAGKKEGYGPEHPHQRVVQVELDQLQGLLLILQGQQQSGLELLTKAAAVEQELPMDFGPPSLHKPANELLGEVLLETGKPQEARRAFENAQLLAPGRTRSLIGLSKCASALKDTELAASVNAKLERTREEARTAQAAQANAG